MRRVLLVVPVVLVLAGCNPGDSVSANSVDTAPGVPQVTASRPGPAPDGAQGRALRSALRPVSPPLDSARSVDRSRGVCVSLLAGIDEAAVVTAVQTQFASTPTILTSAQAEETVKIIKESDWCRG